MSNIEVKKLHTFLGHNDSIYTLQALDDYRFISAGGDGMVVISGLDSKSALELANGYEFTKKDATFFLENSRDFNETYLSMLR